MGSMDADQALAELPFPYAAALRLERQGASDELIAQTVAVALEAVPTLLRVAHIKLDELLDR